MQKKSYVYVYVCGVSCRNSLLSVSCRDLRFDRFLLVKHQRRRHFWPSQMFCFSQWICCVQSCFFRPQARRISVTSKSKFGAKWSEFAVHGSRKIKTMRNLIPRPCACGYERDKQRKHGHTSSLCFPEVSNLKSSHIFQKSSTRL